MCTYNTIHDSKKETAFCWFSDYLCSLLVWMGCIGVWALWGSKQAAGPGSQYRCILLSSCAPWVVSPCLYLQSTCGMEITYDQYTRGSNYSPAQSCPRNSHSCFLADRTFLSLCRYISTSYMFGSAKYFREIVNTCLFTNNYLFIFICISTLSMFKSTYM